VLSDFVLKVSLPEICKLISDTKTNGNKKYNLQIKRHVHRRIVAEENLNDNGMA
jgi:hypothetical protein